MTAQLVGLLILLTAPLLVAHSIVSRVHPVMSLSARWTAIGCLGYGVSLACFHLASAFHSLDFGSLLVLNLASVVAAVLLRRPGSLREDWSALHRLTLEFLRLPFPVLIALVPVFFVFTIAFARALLMPPLAWDSLTYHLVFAARWIQEKEIVGFNAPDAMDCYSHFPIFGEIPTTLFMLPFHGDFLVNLAQMPFLLLLSLGVFALGREYGLSKHLASVGMLCIICSPVVFAYATTAYVDTQSTAFIVAGAVFLLRYWKGGERLDSLLVVFCCGCALGIKLTTVYAAAVLIAFLLLRIGATRGRGRLVWVIVHLAVLVAVGGGKYIHNLLETGNPIYPWALKLGPILLAHESGFVSFFTSLRGPGSPALDWAFLRATFSYAPSSLPLTPGPKFLFLGFLALLSAVHLRRSASGSRWILLAVGLLPLLLFFSDFSLPALVVRRNWPYNTSRFIVGSLAALTVLGLGKLDPNRYVGKAALLVLYGFLGFDLWSANRTFLSPAIGFCVAGALFMLLAAGIAILSVRQESWRAGAAAALCLFILATSSSAVTALAGYRSSTRLAHYRHHLELHNFPRGGYARSWDFVERRGEGRTIAFTTGFRWPGHNWYLYPLFGSQLQNRVVYAGVKRRGDWPTHLDSGMVREGADPRVWLDNLRLLNVDWVVVQLPPPVELSWIRARPSQFRLLFADRAVSIFEFIRTEAGSMNQRVNQSCARAQ